MTEAIFFIAGVAFGASLVTIGVCLGLAAARTIPRPPRGLE